MAKSKKRSIALVPGRGTGEPVNQSTGKNPAEWASDGAARPDGIYQDPSKPSVYHRKGRGHASARKVRRITVYVADELATKMDVRIAHDGGNRSEIVEAALRAYLGSG